MIKTNYGILTAMDILTLQKIERQSKLEVSSMRGKTVCLPTPSFIQLIQLHLARSWQKIVSATTAYQVWLIARTVAERNREQFETAADVAHWMGVNPFSLTDEQFLGLAANLHRVQAQEQLLQGTFDPASYNSVYNLTLLATGDEQAALDARTGSMKVHMEQEIARNGKGR